MSLVVIGGALVLGTFVIIGRMAAGSFEPEVEEEDGVTVEVAMGDDNARAGQKGQLIGIAGGGDGLQGGSGGGNNNDHSIGGQGQGGNDGVIGGGSGVMVGGAQSPVEGKDREHNLTQTETCAHCGAANTSSSSRCWSCGSSPGATIKADTVKIVNENDNQSDTDRLEDESREVASEDVRDPDDYGFNTDKDEDKKDGSGWSEPDTDHTEGSSNIDNSNSDPDTFADKGETGYSKRGESNGQETRDGAHPSALDPNIINSEESSPDQEAQNAENNAHGSDNIAEEADSTPIITDSQAVSVDHSTKTLLLSGLILCASAVGLFMSSPGSGISTMSDAIVSTGIAVLAGSVGSILIYYNGLRNILIGYPLLITGITAPVSLILTGTPAVDIALGITRTTISQVFIPIFSLAGADTVLMGILNTPKPIFVIMWFVVGVVTGIPFGITSYLLEPVEHNNIRNNKDEKSTYYNYE